MKKESIITTPSKRKEPLQQKYILPLILLVVIFISICIGFSQLSTPDVLPLNADKAKFSSERAVRYLGEIANKPRPLGSDEHDRVRDYIVHTLNNIGVSPEIQADEGVFSSWGDPFEGKVENIVARIEGKNSSQAIMITSHYDTVPNSPGAADAGSGVAALLETVRALTNSPALMNDIVILFSDGEESGLLGAQAFVQYHPWAKDVGIVLNFEARGNKGPSVLFETNEGNGKVVAEFVSGSSHPIAHSLLNDLYKNTPHDTDLSIYKSTGMNGLNFAFFEGLFSYHTSEDTIENLSLNSLQHHGEHMIDLVRHFGNKSIVQKQEENRLYFNVIGKHVVSYSEQYVLPIMIICIVGYIFSFINGFRLKELRVTGVGLGTILFMLTTSLAYYTGSGMLKGLEIITGWDRWMMSSYPKISNPMLISIIMFVFALIFPIYQLALKKINECNLTIGAFFGWLVLSIYTSVYFENSSYIFVWPFVFGLIAFNLYIHLKKKHPLMANILSLGMVILPLIFTVPVIYLIYIFFTLEYSGILIAAISLLIAYMIPALNMLAVRSFFIIPSLLLLLGIINLIRESLNL